MGGFKFYCEILETFAFFALAIELAPATNSFRLFALFLLGWLFIVATDLHLAEHAFALHFFLQCAQCLIHVIVADIYTYHTEITPFGVNFSLKIGLYIIRIG